MSVLIYIQYCRLPRHGFTSSCLPSQSIWICKQMSFLVLHQKLVLTHLVRILPRVALAFAADAVAAVVAERGRGVVRAAAALLWIAPVREKSFLFSKEYRDSIIGIVLCSSPSSYFLSAKKHSVYLCSDCKGSTARARGNFC